MFKYFSGKEPYDVFRMTFLKYVIFFTIPYLLFGMYRAFSVEDSHTFILDVILLVITFFILYFVFKSDQFRLLSVLYAVAWSIAFVLYWLWQGGINGPIPYVSLTILIAYATFLPRKLFPPIVIIFLSFCLVLTFLYPTGLNRDILAQLPIGGKYLIADYLLNSFLIGTIVLLIKNRYDKERIQYLGSKKHLIILEEELKVKQRILFDQRLKINQIKQNLEKLVHEHTKELETKHEDLTQYAYNNAHILRMPLCNILGVIQLIEMEDIDDRTKKSVRKFSEKVKNIDVLVSRINSILK